jgi:O-antigen/teichoic acid export membrane protein
LLAAGAKLTLIQGSNVVSGVLPRALALSCLGSSAVATYEILLKLFGVPALIHAITSGPLWPAVAAANARKDYTLLTVLIRQQLRIAIMLLLLLLAVFLLYPYVVRLWIPEAIPTSAIVLVACVAFSAANLINSTLAPFLTGLDALNGPVWCTVAGACAMILTGQFSYVIAENGLSVIFFAQAISVLPACVVYPLILRRFITSKLVVS